MSKYRDSRRSTKMQTPPKFCLCCKSEVGEIMDLGRQPLANNLLINSDDDYEIYDLKLMGCLNCGHLQLSEFIDPDLLFKNYFYASGTSRTLTTYFNWLATSLKTLCESSNYQTILEIASNDGAFLDALKNSDLNVIGVDPALNLNVTARRKGHTIYDGFWPEVAPQLKRKFHIIIAQNVFAHNPDPVRFLQVAADLLEDDGVIVIQTSQAEMILHGQFDTIYHEHHSFFTPSSFKKISTLCDLKINNIFITNIHGGSYLAVLSKKIQNFNKYFTSDWITKEVDLEQNYDGAQFEKLMKSFSLNSFEVVDKTREVTEKYRDQGFRVVFVGAAAKAIVFLNFSKIKTDIIIDEAELKIGKYIPKINLKVEEFSVVKGIKSPILFVIAAWNFREEIKSKLKAIRPDNNDQYLNYFPEFSLSN